MPSQLACEDLLGHLHFGISLNKILTKAVIFRREVIEFNLGDLENFYFKGFCEKKF
jgi:hypothetical protein